MSQYWLFLLLPAFIAGYMTHIYYGTKRDIDLGRLLEWLLVRNHFDIALRVVRLRLLRWSSAHARRQRSTEPYPPEQRKTPPLPARDGVETADSFERDIPT